MLRSHLDGFVKVSAVEDVEAADLRVGIHERALADHRLAGADAHGRRLTNRLAHMALFAHSTRFHLAHPGAHGFWDGGALFRRQLNRSVGIDEQDELHDEPPRCDLRLYVDRCRERYSSP